MFTQSFLYIHPLSVIILPPTCSRDLNRRCHCCQLDSIVVLRFIETDFILASSTNSKMKSALVKVLHKMCVQTLPDPSSVKFVAFAIPFGHGSTDAALNTGWPLNVSPFTGINWLRFDPAQCCLNTAQPNRLDLIICEGCKRLNVGTSCFFLRSFVLLFPRSSVFA